jgi:hypothetical protein
MHFNSAALALLGSIAVAECGTLGHLNVHQHLDRRLGSPVLRRQANPTCLDPAVIATGSALTGQEPGTDGVKAGQAPSAT